MWLVEPKIIGDVECEGNNGDCNCYINFSDPSIPSILQKGCIGGIPDNLGDLDNNGTDEVGLLREWFSSCWRDYPVWTLKSNARTYLIDPISTHCNLWEEGKKPIQKDPKKQGYVIINYSNEDVESDNFLETETQSVKMY
jgi:hypothetical protein